MSIWSGMEKEMEEALKRAIKAVGGDKEVGGGSAMAKICGVTRSGVSQWRIAPAGRVLQIEKASGVSRHELRPDICGKKEE